MDDDIYSKNFIKVVLKEDGSICVIHKDLYYAVKTFTKYCGKDFFLEDDYLINDPVVVLVKFTRAQGTVDLTLKKLDNLVKSIKRFFNSKRFKSQVGCTECTIYTDGVGVEVIFSHTLYFD